MRLLITTQVVDQDHTVLGFFHEWIVALAPYFETVEVICLFEGVHSLPSNVHVHSLGKEKGVRSAFSYGSTLLSLVWKLRHNYDAVFVHMNEEHVLAAGWLWALLRKPVYMWRNHYSGSLLTHIAGAWCKKVFFTSLHSYTASFRNAVRMPVGVDTNRFHTDSAVVRQPRSILFFGRLSPSKRAELLIDALRILKEKQIAFTASFVGSYLPKDAGYVTQLRARTEGLATFSEGIPHHEAGRVFGAHEIYVNTSPSGMLDKTIFEAAAAGCLVLTSSEDIATMLPETLRFTTTEELVSALERLFVLSPEERAALLRTEQEMVAQHSLTTLTERIVKEVLG